MSGRAKTWADLGWPELEGCEVACPPLPVAKPILYMNGREDVEPDDFDDLAADERLCHEFARDPWCPAELRTRLREYAAKVARWRLR